MKNLIGMAGLISCCLFGAATATAQKPESCSGTLEVIRFSALKPGFTIDDFRKVADRHIAWYRRHGYARNQQIVAPVMTIAGVNPGEVVTIHVNAPGVGSDEHDAEWDDFTMAYKKMSTVEAMRTVCLPK